MCSNGLTINKKYMIAIISKLSKSKFVRRLTKGEAAKTVTLPSEETKRMKQEGKKTTSLKTPPVMLKVFTEDYIRKNPEDLAKSTLDNYRCAVNSLLRFLGGKDVSFMQFTVLRMKEFEHWLDAHSVSPNTAAVYMRSLRALYNKAPLGKRQKESNPFATVKTSNLKTDKRAAETSDLRRLAALDLKVGTFLCLSRDVFLFSVYAMGMPFVDAAHLKKYQIHDGMIEYRRQKTGKVIRVKIEPCMQALIDRYNERGNEYVFPILKRMVHEKCEKDKKSKKDKISGDKLKVMERQYSSTLCYYNQELKKLGNMVGVKIKLTSYVARHTWASLAYINKVDLAVISQALGHSSTTTTQIYIKGINGNVVFKANRLVLNMLGNTKKAKKMHLLVRGLIHRLIH
jgi:integrase/recombinase XerD